MARHGVLERAIELPHRRRLHSLAPTLTLNYVRCTLEAQSDIDTLVTSTAATPDAVAVTKEQVRDEYLKLSRGKGLEVFNRAFSIRILYATAFLFLVTARHLCTKDFVPLNTANRVLEARFLRRLPSMACGLFGACPFGFALRPLGVLIFLISDVFTYDPYRKPNRYQYRWNDQPEYAEALVRRLHTPLRSTLLGRRRHGVGGKAVSFRRFTNAEHATSMKRASASDKSGSASSACRIPASSLVYP